MDVNFLALSSLKDMQFKNDLGSLLYVFMAEFVCNAVC